ncbi:hypothetical protein RRSWK_06041 [Rhodopirellula sp. SWK7]|nr:hypothetical protein RRSWK_06041 [Rhodopirellula sp. SWK7]
MGFNDGACALQTFSSRVVASEMEKSRRVRWCIVMLKTVEEMFRFLSKRGSMLLIAAK